MYCKLNIFEQKVSDTHIIIVHNSMPDKKGPYFTDSISISFICVSRYNCNGRQDKFILNFSNTFLFHIWEVVWI